MADKPAADAEAKPKSKKLLVIILVVVLVLLLGLGAAAFLLLKSGSGDDIDDPEATTQPVRDSRPRTPPQYMALDPVVINLADPGAIRYAQVGITLQVDSAATADRIKAYLPTVRNGILRQISRRTAEELLRPEGKDQLAQDILDLVREETGLAPVRGESPVQAVLFSSLIVQ
ncbi:flagellar basal body-associated FliL family protein [Tepidicella baoligensis]|uniref:flagellar basal body-associated FliL family protein n=1 Tax=Tepidicella baoligensis TaxID=2707016 RepID=UPI0015DA87E4|nr:flagellar basal body-associated FliL family protein [Tepidicella baoligensis]